jgi:hypothetical protein
MRSTIMIFAALLLSANTGCVASAHAHPVRPAVTAPPPPAHVNVRAWVWLDGHWGPHGWVRAHWVLRVVPTTHFGHHPNTHVRYVAGRPPPRQHPRAHQHRQHRHRHTR